MRVWLLKIGEPLPTDGENVRLHRTGQLAKILVNQGHDVVWWTSTFSHQSKTHRSYTDSEIRHDGMTLRLLHGNAYKRNISVARIINHRRVAATFWRLAHSESQPDVILSAYPAIELASRAVQFGVDHRIPVVLDIRDLWPDIFHSALPCPLRSLAGLAIRRLDAEACRAMRNAVSLTAMSSACLDWGLRKAGRVRREDDRVFHLGCSRPQVSEVKKHAAAQRLGQIGVHNKATICWFVGMFGRMYDLRTVILAANDVCRKYPNVQFVFSGDGERRGEWEALAAGNPRIIFTGWINQPEIAAMMEMADIGLVAYDAGPEFLPNKIFEYFSAGIPVVSSLIGDEPKQLLTEHQCGFSYQPRNVQELVGALELLIRNESLRHQFGRNARSLYEERFSADRIYPEMADYLISIAERHHPLALST